MVQQILFIQGGGEGAHDAWDNKLVDSLQQALGHGFEIRYPRMPGEDDPKFARWKAAIEAEMARLDDGAILVGHSIGATVLIHSLAETPPKLRAAGIFLISAPFVGEGGWLSEEVTPKPDLGAQLPADTPIYFYQGDADETVPEEHAELYAKAVPQAVVRRLAGRDHQLNDDVSEVAADILSPGAA